MNGGAKVDEGGGEEAEAEASMEGIGAEAAVEALEAVDEGTEDDVEGATESVEGVEVNGGAKVAEGEASMEGIGAEAAVEAVEAVDEGTAPVVNEAVEEGGAKEGGGEGGGGEGGGDGGGGDGGGGDGGGGDGGDGGGGDGGRYAQYDDKCGSNFAHLPSPPGGRDGGEGGGGEGGGEGGGGEGGGEGGGGDGGVKEGAQMKGHGSMPHMMHGKRYTDTFGRRFTYHCHENWHAILWDSTRPLLAAGYDALLRMFGECTSGVCTVTPVAPSADVPANARAGDYVLEGRHIATILYGDGRVLTKADGSPACDKATYRGYAAMAKVPTKAAVMRHTTGASVLNPTLQPRVGGGSIVHIKGDEGEGCNILVGILKGEERTSQGSACQSRMVAATYNTVAHGISLHALASVMVEEMPPTRAPAETSQAAMTAFQQKLASGLPPPSAVRARSLRQEARSDRHNETKIADETKRRSKRQNRDAGVKASLVRQDVKPKSEEQKAGVPQVDALQAALPPAKKAVKVKAPEASALVGMTIRRVHSKYAKAIVTGKKTMEIVGQRSHIRGEVLIAELNNSDAEHPAKVIGAVDAVDCVHVDRHAFEQHAEKHLAADFKNALSWLDKKSCFAILFARPRQYRVPVPFKMKSGGAWLTFEIEDGEEGGEEGEEEEGGGKEEKEEGGEEEGGDEEGEDDHAAEMSGIAARADHKATETEAGVAERRAEQAAAKAAENAAEEEARAADWQRKAVQAAAKAVKAQEEARAAKARAEADEARADKARDARKADEARADEARADAKAQAEAAEAIVKAVAMPNAKASTSQRESDAAGIRRKAVPVVAASTSLHEILKELEQSSGICCLDGEPKLHYLRRLAGELGVEVENGASLMSCALSLRADIGGSWESIHSSDHKPEYQPSRAPTATAVPLAGRRRHESPPAPVLAQGGTGGGGGEQGCSGDGDEDGITYSQERRLLRLARLEAEEEAQSQHHTSSRFVEKRLLEEEIRIRGWKRNSKKVKKADGRP